MSSKVETEIFLFENTVFDRSTVSVIPLTLKAS